jgi:hypothetical protein
LAQKLTGTEPATRSIDKLEVIDIQQNRYKIMILCLFVSYKIKFVVILHEITPLQLQFVNRQLKNRKFVNSKWAEGLADENMSACQPPGWRICLAGCPGRDGAIIMAS